MIRKLLFAACSCLAVMARGQGNQSTGTDTTKVLDEVVVHAYANDRDLREVPASIGFLDSKAMERFSNTSFLPAVNTIPGVRMEERSPGSYRFAVRGSSLRSPFGVRNVKMYWNGLPLTDGGGNTYLNLVDVNAVEKAEIIKGPGGSLYGAGTGGVLLLTTPVAKQIRIQHSVVGGSFGLLRYQESAQFGTGKISGSANYGHQQALGYREQTAMRRDAFNTDWRFALGGKSTLSATLFYSDLKYQTPGGLTKVQFDQDPKQARPGATGAVAQKATVYNKTFYGGLMYDYQWNDHWSSRLGLYSSSTDFVNPTLRNYEKRKESNWGGRTETQYAFERTSWKGKITMGGEFQHFYSPLTDYDNNLGEAGNVQTDDRLYSTQLLLFAQAEFDLPGNFYLTLGGSDNFLNYKFERLSPAPPSQQERNFNQVFSPRVALLKKLTDNFSVYGSVSNGFSPPSLAEVRPSSSTYNNTLNPESGTSYEIGTRGRIGKQFSYDITGYHFKLDETIVVQYQVSGSDFFHNAGSTSQDGLETMLAWTPVNALKLWTSYTLNRYKFKNYVQDSVSFSGKKLTGVSPNIVVAGVDFTTKHYYANFTYNFVDKIPLDNANTAFASTYSLFGMRAGYKTIFGKYYPFEVFAGVDNALDARYSLGNDLNAVGGRYYNAAAGRNYYIGLKIGFRK